MRHAAAALLLLAAALPAAARFPSMDPPAIVVKVGETATVRVYAVPEYFSDLWMEFEWTFRSRNASIAKVEGSMRGPSEQPGLMRITGMRPGTTKGLVVEYNGDRYFVDVTVRCGNEPAIRPAAELQTAKPGETVTLRAVTLIAARTTFTWYHGEVGDLSEPIAASGPEIAFAVPAAGRHHVWVMATTPCSTSTAQFEIDAGPARRRIVRH